MFPDGSFEAAVENLNPGDRLVVHEGTYTDTGRISIRVQGSASQPVIIEAAAGEARPLITRDGSASVQNTINIEGARYVTIRGLEISGNGGDAVNMNGEPSFITLEDLEIHDISVGINFRSDMNNIVARGNHIYRTSDTGEGMYVGCNNAACVVSDSLIESNWVHDTFAASQGDGIEIKRGSHSNIVRNNVIHDTNYPCILVYGTDGNPRNVIEGNVMWNCGDSGIQAAADALITNNVIIDSPRNGFNSQLHQGVTPGNLEFVHNTLVGGDPCLRIADWNNKTGMVFANNAVYCESGAFSVGGLGAVQVAGNVFAPAASSFPSVGFSTGRSIDEDFVDAASRDFYPSAGSPLRDAADPLFGIADDFNGQSRSGSRDAGAYTWVGAENPGWHVGPGFKKTNPAPALTISASATTVILQGQSTLSWTATDVTGCTAGGAWSGAKALSGQETVGPLTSTSQFTLTCTNADNVSASESITVTVSPGTATPPTLVFSAGDSTVAASGSTMLNWSATDATACSAADGWDGLKPVTGSESTGAITATAQYSLECTGSGGAIARSVTVQVQSAGGDSGDPTSNSSGGGVLGWMSVVLCLIVGRRLARGTHDGRRSGGLAA